ncbi:MBL fold metallo-hydrolase [Mucilaginibacter sp.]|uniref:MBL fold metallo-hydrolase n=1 Tax=Mucilaginibacter sp. TaxID=1882438 RepID=UPI003B009E6B
MENQEIKTTTGKSYFEVAPGIWGMKIVFVNIYMIASGDADSKKWVLVDAGLPHSAHKIKAMAEDIFGEGTKPENIILTHGHFDHTGSLQDLLKIWDVPVYAHHLELPYLTGKSAYPPADPFVGGGLMSLTSWMFPNKPLDLGNKIHEFPAEGTPGLPGWRIIPTPGHAPGHVSLFRESDHVLIAGDAFVTTVQESALSVILQQKVISGPPKYFTCDWKAAGTSVRKLIGLHPQIVATGHGKPMAGKEFKKALQNLGRNFASEAVPTHGRYVKEAAQTDMEGVKYVPPAKNNPALMATLIGTAAVVAFAVVINYRKK